jgi:hypothetical protein
MNHIPHTVQQDDVYLVNVPGISLTDMFFTALINWQYFLYNRLTKEFRKVS